MASRATSRVPEIVGAALLLALVASACGEGPTETSVEDLPPPGESLSAEQRSRAMEDVQARVQSAVEAGDDDPRAQLRAAADRIREMPEVLATVVSEQALSATVVLRGGMELVLMNNRRVGPGGSAASASRTGSREAAGADSASAEPSVSTAPAELPSASKAVVWTIGGQGSSGTADRVEALLRQAGYDIAGRGGSLQAMRSYDDIGALYLDTHGAAYRTGSIDTQNGVFRPGPTRYALQTSTSLEGDRREQFVQSNQGAIQDGRIVLSIPMQEPEKPWKVAITDEFIASHWDLNGGFALIHACYLGSAPFSPGGDCSGKCSSDGSSGERTFHPEKIRQAVLRTAGALVSFDNLTNARYARPSILYVFDRMLGTNERDPQRDPPLRPFDLAQVAEGLEERGLKSFDRPSWVGPLGVLESEGNQVRVTVHGDASGTILRPSIRGMEIVDDAAQSDGRLTLRGSFGSTQGEVRIAGTELDVTSWSADEIVARAPFEGAAARGPVTVSRSGQVESNAVPLTRWEGRLTGSVAHCGARANGELDVRFRADVHRRRDELLAEADLPEEVVSYISPATEGDVRANGAGCGDSPVTWTGGKEFRILTRQEVRQGGNVQWTYQESLFGGRVRFRSGSGGVEAELCQQLKPAWTAVAPNGNRGPLGFPVMSVLWLLSSVDRVAGMGCVERSLNGDHGFPGTSATATEEEFQFNADWGNFSAQSPPTGETAG